MPTLKSIRRAYRELNRQQSGKRIAELRKLAKQRAEAIEIARKDAK